MAFSGAVQTDASRSTFIDVGRDHVTINQIALINLPLSSLGSLYHLLRTSAHDLMLPIATFQRPEPLLEGNTIISSEADPNTTAHDIVETVQSLIALESTDHYRDLEPQLELLQRTLNLTGLAVQAYRDTPFGQSLTTTINREIAACSAVLQELLDTINDLNSSRIRHLSTLLLWSRNDNLASLKTKLFACRNSINRYLKALDHIPWEELESELRTNRISVREFHTRLKQDRPFLRHILISKITVVDHLGRNIPMPTVFCSTWNDFDYIINGYCKDRIGDHIIKRGHYQVMRADDSQVIGRSELPNVAVEGMMLELTIILRRGGVARNICPRCSYSNQSVIADSGWIECRKCSGQFRVADSDENEEIVSSASQTIVNNKRRSDEGEEQQRKRRRTDNGDSMECDGDGDDEEGIQFFRRVQLIHNMDTSRRHSSSAMTRGARYSRGHRFTVSEGGNRFLSPYVSPESLMYLGEDLRGRVHARSKTTFSYKSVSRGPYERPPHQTSVDTSLVIPMFAGPISGHSAKHIVATDAMIQASACRRKRVANYFCSKCGNSFTTKTSRKRHITSHSSEKPYVCSFPDCGQTFSNDDDHKRHENKSKKHTR